MRYEGILDTIGRTPAVRLNRLAPAHVNLYVKVESFNPMGSVKDRLALGVIERAEQDGSLKPGQTVIEATSGNTGIGLAMVCAAKGYPLVVTMAENFSVERRRLMRFLGARVVLTPAALKGSGMLAKARELAAKHGWFLTRQFENEANADIHTRTTAVEILADFADTRLDAWVTGYGTGGTLKGVGRVLRAKRPGTRIFVCEPDNSQVLGSGIPQERAADGSPAASHPLFRPHAMQGWSPDFIPKLTEDAVRDGLVDRVVPVNGAEALKTSRRLATEEGILVGISAGATVAGAISICAELPEGANVLAMLPDTGERYLTTPLFEDIPADMTEEELEISRSTPGYRFDTPSPAVSPAPSASPVSAASTLSGVSTASQTPASSSATGSSAVTTASATTGRAEVATAAMASAGGTALAKASSPLCVLPTPQPSAPVAGGVSATAAIQPEAASFVEEVLADRAQPVVLFALEWCEFSWSVRKLFDRLKVPFRSIDLDSVAYQRDDRGGQVRAALAARIGVPTIPQVFIGGEHLGGATDLFDAWRAGKAQRLLDESGVAYDRNVAIDPYSFLPKWLQPR